MKGVAAIAGNQDIAGLLVVDKPLGLTSRDAINRAWRWLPKGTRIGHTGTLDPLATGVLVVCVGAATRLAEYVQRMEKVYQARVRLGIRSTTDDAEGTLTESMNAAVPALDQLSSALQMFRGKIEQVPPAHSAAKVTGRRAYAMARKGQEVSLAARTIVIHELVVRHYAYPTLDLEIRCGKGTYIRALARDLGETLGCGAYLESLRRVRVGPFRVEDALSLDLDRDAACSRLLPLVEAVRELPALILPEDQVGRVRTGLGVSLPQGLADGDEIALLSAARDLLAVGRVDADRGLILPQKVFV